MLNTDVIYVSLVVIIPSHYIIVECNVAKVNLPFSVYFKLPMI